MKKILSLILIVAVITSCSESIDSPSINDEACFHFDQKQCNYDEWADLLTESTDLSGWEQAMTDYFNSKGVALLDIFIDYSFYRLTCAACEICPMDHRFYIKVSQSDADKLYELDLLNLDTENCSDIF